MLNAVRDSRGVCARAGDGTDNHNSTHATAYGCCVKDCHSLLRSNAWPCSAARASLLRGFYAAAAHEPTRSDILAKPFGI